MQKLYKPLLYTIILFMLGVLMQYLRLGAIIPSNVIVLAIFYAGGACLALLDCLAQSPSKN